MEGGGARWKSRDAAALARADPMSKIVSELQSSFHRSQTCGLLTGSAVLVQAEPEQTKLLNRACFGRPIITADPSSSSSMKGTRVKLNLEQEGAGLQWFQLGLEEAFYLSHQLGCLIICQSTPEGRKGLSHEQIWCYMKERQKTFVPHYKAYSHLRAKNWVVRSGLQYGAEFVVYRHHPALVHSEYAVIVSSETDDRQARLTTWSDWQSMLRLCGSVAKTLLLLSIIPKSNIIEEASPTCLDNYHVEEFEIKRWMAEKHREDFLSGKDER
uniref:tRNA-intron lyase n=1 Tax=Araucaria cunninghamii TaxID=56994 RepID=A0A0D6R9W3_ARACU